MLTGGRGASVDDRIRRPASENRLPCFAVGCGGVVRDGAGERVADVVGGGAAIRGRAWRYVGIIVIGRDVVDGMRPRVREERLEPGRGPVASASGLRLRRSSA